MLYTTDVAGNKISQNIIGPQENIIATIRYEEDGQAAYFYNKHIRTSVTNVVDDSGLGVVSYKYDDYGTTTKYGDQDFYNEICYTSGVYDELTSLYYLNARYYNPSTAMFMTQDSYRGEQNDYGTWNMYAYCGGNPINYVDPSGHHPMALPFYEYGVANAWNPSGWVSIGVGTLILVGSLYILYVAGEKITVYYEVKYYDSIVNKRKLTTLYDTNRIAYFSTKKPTSKSYFIQKGEKGRIDVEPSSSGGGKSGIHYHAPNNKKYWLTVAGKFIDNKGKEAPKRIRKIIESEEFKKVLKRALRYLNK